MRYCILIVLSIAYSLTGNAQRARYNFNPGWLLSIGDTRMRRNSLHPIATANSYDDDETTAWSNALATRTDIYPDGLPIRNAKPDATPVNASLGTAWIEYTLAQPTTPTQLELKLTAFRLRRYPMRITLDGTTVYEGTTPTSLGYITSHLSRSFTL